jgi:hypothetical protein
MSWNRWTEAEDLTLLDSGVRLGYVHPNGMIQDRGKCFKTSWSRTTTAEMCCSHGTHNQYCMIIRVVMHPPNNTARAINFCQSLSQRVTNTNISHISVITFTYLFIQDNGAVLPSKIFPTNASFEQNTKHATMTEYQIRQAWRCERKIANYDTSNVSAGQFWISVNRPPQAGHVENEPPQHVKKHYIFMLRVETPKECFGGDIPKGSFSLVPTASNLRTRYSEWVSWVFCECCAPTLHNPGFLYQRCLRL